MCGCENENEYENDEELKRCFSGFVCLPYDDPYVIASQVLAVVAFLISWVWWASFIISIIAMILIQLIWCCRQSKAGLLTAHVIAVVAALLCMVSGIYMLVAWKSAWWCAPFVMISDDDYTYASDNCNEQAWAAVAFVDAALWLASAGCLIAFVNNGHYAKWEARLSSRQQQQQQQQQQQRTHPTAVEMVNNNTQPAEISTDNAIVATATSSPVLPVTVPVASAPSAYVPLEVVVEINRSELEDRWSNGCNNKRHSGCSL